MLTDTTVLETAEPAPSEWGNRSNRGRLLRIWLVAVAIAPTAVVLTRLLTLESSQRFGLFEDDAYYYFGIARSIADGDGSTFTGLLHTNGYHPLWLMLLVPMASLLRNQSNLLFGVLLLQAILWAGCVREASIIGRRVGSHEAGIAGIAGLGVLALAVGRISFSGMESGLTLFLLLWLTRRAADAQVGPPRADTALGFLLGMVCLSRLDAILVCVPIGVVLLFRGRLTRRERAALAIRLALPPALLLIAFTTWNLAVFGTASPVSGQAKSVGAPFLNTKPLNRFLIGAEFAGRPLWIGVVSVFVVTIACIVTLKQDVPTRTLLMRIALAAMVGEALLLLYLVVSTSYPTWAWYHYPVAFFGFCGVVLLTGPLVHRFGRPARVVALTLSVVVVSAQAVSIHDNSDIYAPSVAAAHFVRDNTKPTDVFAMGNRAGIFGYLGDRPLLQLEGLVADGDYIDDLRRGTILTRAAAVGVDYYVSDGPPGERAIVDGELCREFVEPLNSRGPRVEVVVCDEDRVFSAGHLTIWRFRPELNGT